MVGVWVPEEAGRKQWIQDQTTSADSVLAGGFPAEVLEERRDLLPGKGGASSGTFPVWSLSGAGSGLK